MRCRQRAFRPVALLFLLAVLAESAIGQDNIPASTPGEPTSPASAPAPVGTTEAAQASPQPAPAPAPAPAPLQGGKGNPIIGSPITPDPPLVQPPPPHPGSSCNGGCIAGIVIGVVVGLAFLGIIVAFSIWRGSCGHASQKPQPKDYSAYQVAKNQHGQFGAADIQSSFPLKQGQTVCCLLGGTARIGQMASFTPSNNLVQVRLPNGQQVSVGPHDIVQLYQVNERVLYTDPVNKVSKAAIIVSSEGRHWPPFYTIRFGDESGTTGTVQKQLQPFPKEVV